MPALLGAAPLTDAERAANDTRRVPVVLAALAVIALYAYLFTHAYEYLGIPGPRELAQGIGLSPDHVFDRDGNVDSSVQISYAEVFSSSDDERLAYYLVLVCAFLSAYFLPVRHKQAAIALWSVLGFALLFGIGPAAALLCAHAVVHLTLHPRRERPWLHGALPGLLALVAVGPAALSAPWPWLTAPLATAVVYRFGWLRLLESAQIARWLRTAVVQCAIITLLVGAVREGLSGDEWKLPLGIVLFFFQFERLILYHADYEDGLVPADLPYLRYLAVFLTPATIPAVHLRIAIGQGYAYINSKFLCVDKNRIVMRGVRLMLLALVYIVFGDWIRNAAIGLMQAMDVDVYDARIRNMVRAFARGEEIGTATVLATTMLELLRWLLFFAGISHFKVGVWRLCGYDVDPAYDKPWLATNLATLWARYTFHYREFLVRAFYYPVFFRFFKRRLYLRIFVATFAATGIGNLIWGHVVFRLNWRGMEWDNVLVQLEKWPYFVLLGGGISLTYVYLRWRKSRRKPWTLDRWIWTDVVAVYCTLQFFALIHVFARSTSTSTTWDLLRLFAKGFAIDLPAL